LPAVVHGERQAHGIRHDGGTARPGLDDLLRSGGHGGLNFLHEVAVDEGPLLDASRHGLTLALAAADDHSVGPLVVTSFEAFRELSPGRARVAPAGAAAFAAAHGVINGVHRDPSVVRPPPEPAGTAGLAKADAAVLAV